MKKTNADYFGCVLLFIGYIGGLGALVWLVWLLCSFLRSMG